VHYPNGYCATVTGGAVVSKPNAEHLDIDNTPGARAVTVSVVPGDC
jgi:hypothetical protein